MDPVPGGQKLPTKKKNVNAFHSDADPDPTFQFDAAPDPTTHLFPDLDPNAPK